ncbi:MAG: hypothetical protein ACFFBP_06585 [Promethearchaeota archaeon]
MIMEMNIDIKDQIIAIISPWVIHKGKVQKIIAGISISIEQNKSTQSGICGVNRLTANANPK